ncbi:MAG: hypothetical protein COB04_14305 [Gammaproteobacteria bacterium]|nr:MAG: hypothetical protein COB04_14305 [Gammaproteobacteria bacterium]
MLTALAKLLQALNAETRPAQISLAFVMGLILGFTPLWSVHNLLVLFLACIVRVNFSSFLLAWGLFSSIAYWLDPVFIGVGESVLNQPSLQGAWSSMYQSDLWRVTHFNHTLTMGSVLVSLIIAVPLFFVSNLLIELYRDKLFVWVQKFRLVQMLKTSKLYNIYQALDARGIV